MARYYANWAGVGMMAIAEGLTIGGTSKYVLLKFPNIPETLKQARAGYQFVR